MIVPRKIKGYGWRPAPPDFRDAHYMVAHDPSIVVPSSVDWTNDPRMPPVWDQGQEGSCTGHGSTAAVMFETGYPMLSRQQVYGNGRKLEGTFKQDSGCSVRDVLKAFSKLGAAPEELWPYSPSTFAKTWPGKVTTAGKQHTFSTYHAVPQSLPLLKQQLALGKLLVFGFSVYAGFESEEVAKTGDVQMPASKEAQLGGHCVAGVGFDDSISRFRCRNSWSASWGNRGYFTLPYEYLLNPRLASEIFVVAK